MLDLSALTPPAVLETSRLRLEPLGHKHVEGVLSGLNDEETRRLTGTHATFTEEGVQRFLARLADDASRADWAILDAERERYLGEIVLNELDEENRSMSFRVALVPGAPGSGYGTEATAAVLDYAFETIGVHRVFLEVYTFNPRALRSYEKSGFRVEGRQRHTLFWDGEWIDSVLMSVLETDPRPRSSPSAGSATDNRMGTP